MSFPLRFSFPEAFLLIALYGAGALLGDYAHLELFWGVWAMFGSVVVLMVFSCYSSAWGLMVAVLAYAIGAYLQGLPYVMLVQFGEALAVAIFYRRTRDNLVVLVGFYWLLVGMPATGLYQYFQLDNGSAMTLIQMLRAGINGVFNALVAVLVVQVMLLLRWWRCQPGERQPTITLRQLLFNLLLAAVMLPSLLIIVLDGHHQTALVEQAIQNELNVLSRDMASKLARSTPEERRAQVERYEYDSMYEAHRIDITLLSEAGMVEASTRLEIKPGAIYDPRHDGEISQVGNQVFRWQPRMEGQIAGLRWKNMRYVMESPVGGEIKGKLVAEISISYFQQQISEGVLRNFLILSGLTLLAFFLGGYLSRLIVVPLTQLAEETDNLRVKLITEQELRLPDVPVAEMENLVLNFREMAGTLSRSFNDLYDLNEKLEARVVERTSELSLVNRQLQREVQASNEQALQLMRATVELETQKFALDQHSIVAITDRYGTITYVNDKFCEISQYSREELLGQNHRILNSGYHSHDFFQAMLSTIAQGKVWQGEIRNRRRDGSFYWVDTSIVPFMDSRGNPYQYVAIRTDITERKRNEEELIHARDQAEAASRAKSDFLSRMSHELRTPLNAIIGFTQLLESGVDGDLNPAQRESAGHILQSGWHLLDLINEILDLARIESGRMAINLESVEFGPMAEECADMIMPFANQRNVVIDSRIAAQDGQWWIRADRVRVKQVLLNLMSNAVKYNRAEGLVTLASERTDSGMIRIAVSDCGIGIAEDQIPRLFQPFSRLDADKSEIQGAGVGLAVTKSLVELMGGRIGVESVVGEGTTFWFELMAGNPPSNEVWR